MALRGKMTNCFTISHLAAVFVSWQLPTCNWRVCSSHLLLQQRNYIPTIMSMSNSAETWRGKAGLLMQPESGHGTGYSCKTDVLLLWIEAFGNGKGPKSHSESLWQQMREEIVR
jgi:hypothetical protein